MTPTLQAVAWTLIHFCWQAAAIAAAYRIASIALARASSSTRYAAALVALMLMLGVSAATFMWEMRSGAAALASSAPATAQAPRNFSPTVTAASGVAANPEPRTMQPGPRGFLTGTGLPWPVLPQSLFPLIDGIWLAGVVALSLRSLGGWWLIQRLRASATVEAPASVRASFRRISAALGLRRPVMLRVSSAIAAPVTVGAIRALVLLPISAATQLSADELEMVLAHELAHVRRADFLWNLVQTLVETLFFFHPAVWWIGSRLRHERELCCDDLALEVCPNPAAYANALFRLEVERGRHSQFAMALNGHQSGQTLRMRIARILGEPAAQAGSRGPFSLAAAGAVLLVLLLPVPQVLASLSPARAAVTVPVPSIAVMRPEIGPARPALAAISQRVAIAKPHPLLEAAVLSPQEDAQVRDDGKGDYIDKMKAAGYDVDLDKYIAMKTMDVTPEYARAMNQLGFGKLSADDLIACKVQDVTPEFIANLKKDGLEVKNVQDAISYRIFNVTAEFVAGMKAAGFDGLTHDQLMALRVQGVTPEFATAIRKQFPSATVDDVVKTKIFNIDEAFIASAKKHGFNDLSLEKLVQLRISGILDDESEKK